MDKEIAQHIADHVDTTVTNSWIEELLKRLETSENKVLTVRRWLIEPVPYLPGEDIILSGRNTTELTANQLTPIRR